MKTKEINEKLLPFYDTSTAKKARVADNFLGMEAAIGLAGESGEVVDIIKKHVMYGRDLDKEHLTEEVGDALHYLLRIVHFYLDDLSLEEIMKANILKLEKRYGK